MKKLLFAIVGVCLLMLLLCGGGLFWAYRAASAVQAEFFTAVGSGDPQQALNLMHPALRDEVDAPVFAAWMDEVNTQLGDYQGVGANEFKASTRIENGQRITQCSGEVRFARGTATSELVYHDGLLTRFSIESPQIPKRWFKGPKGTSVYQDRGSRFLTAFFNREAEAAFGMMHEALQTVMPKEKLSELVEKLSETLGPLQSINYKTDQFLTGEEEALVVYFEVVGEKTSTIASTEFQFKGMKGYLTAFNMSAELP